MNRYLAIKQNNDELSCSDKNMNEFDSEKKSAILAQGVPIRFQILFDSRPLR